MHAEKQGHLQDWDGIWVFLAGVVRKMVEVAYTATAQMTNHKKGSMSLSCVAAGLVVTAGLVIMAAEVRKSGPIVLFILRFPFR